MDNARKMEQLLRDYGYPEEAIPSLLKEIGTLSYEKVEKLIMPYHDITANKS
ncbi:hypothetical protein ACFOU2_01685 [Bacillus songklensis]|uniref:Uncharacterized protein n=1 Tax=Bacillus songklensis TaxID=1069116 RepID=A0ABV8AXA7_9BACI